eukprot:m.122093 g.122093  ORF g.122093 m.122093 type:complete len:634 (+) comp14415_c0_seq7:142-2043(+)
MADRSLDDAPSNVTVPGLGNGIANGHDSGSKSQLQEKYWDDTTLTQKVGNHDETDKPDENGNYNDILLFGTSMDAKEDKLNDVGVSLPSQHLLENTAAQTTRFSTTDRVPDIRTKTNLGDNTATMMSPFQYNSRDVGINTIRNKVASLLGTQSSYSPSLKQGRTSSQFNMASSDFNGRLARQYREQIDQMQRERDLWTAREQEQVEVVRACLKECDELRQEHAARQESLRQFQQEMTIAVETLDNERREWQNQVADQKKQIMFLEKELQTGRVAWKTNSDKIERESQRLKEEIDRLSKSMLDLKEEYTTAKIDWNKRERVLQSELTECRASALAFTSKEMKRETASATEKSELQGKVLELQTENKKLEIEIAKSTEVQNALRNRLTHVLANSEEQKANMTEALKANMEEKLLRSVSEEQAKYTAAMDEIRARHREQLQGLRKESPLLRQGPHSQLGNSGSGLRLLDDSPKKSIYSTPNFPDSSKFTDILKKYDSKQRTENMSNMSPKTGLKVEEAKQQIVNRKPYDSPSSTELSATAKLKPSRSKQNAGTAKAPRRDYDKPWLAARQKHLEANTGKGRKSPLLDTQTRASASRQILDSLRGQQESVSSPRGKQESEHKNVNGNPDSNSKAVWK